MFRGEQKLIENQDSAVDQQSLNNFLWAVNRTGQSWGITHGKQKHKGEHPEQVVVVATLGMACEKSLYLRVTKGRSQQFPVA